MNVIYREKLQEQFNIIIVQIVSEDDKAFKLLKKTILVYILTIKQNGWTYGTL